MPEYKSFREAAQRRIRKYAATTKTVGKQHERIEGQIGTGKKHFDKKGHMRDGS